MHKTAFKTVRFSQLVNSSGNPEPAVLWTPPEQDSRFMKAVRQDRVVSIKQPNVGARKDFGIVGFVREKNTSYLVFPKPLSAFPNARVIGIKYQLIEHSTPPDPVSPKKPARSKSKKSRQPKTSPFHVTLTGSKEISFEIQATNRKEAVQKALHQAKNQSPAQNSEKWQWKKKSVRPSPPQE